MFCIRKQNSYAARPGNGAVPTAASMHNPLGCCRLWSEAWIASGSFGFRCSWPNNAFSPLPPCSHPLLRSISAVSSGRKKGFHAPRLSPVDSSLIGQDDAFRPRQYRRSTNSRAGPLKPELVVQAALTQHHWLPERDLLGELHGRRDMPA